MKILKFISHNFEMIVKIDLELDKEIQLDLNSFTKIFHTISENKLLHNHLENCEITPYFLIDRILKIRYPKIILENRKVKTHFLKTSEK